MMAIMIIGCKDDETPAPETSATNALTGSWVTAGGYVKVGSDDVSSDYTNFKITFSKTNTAQFIYTVENGGYAFAGITADTWSFNGSGFTAIQRNSDDVVMNYTITGGFLTLTFTIPDTFEDGRVNGLFGNFEMKLKKI